MVVSEGPTQASGINVVGDNIVVIGELLKADGASAALLENLPF